MITDISIKLAKRTGDAKAITYKVEIELLAEELTAFIEHNKPYLNVFENELGKKKD